MEKLWHRITGHRAEQGTSADAVKPRVAEEHPGGATGPPSKTPQKSSKVLKVSTDCLALGVRRINRVSEIERPQKATRAEHISNLTWNRGHFPYPECSASGPTVEGGVFGGPVPPEGVMARFLRSVGGSAVRTTGAPAKLLLTVLMVADFKYAARIPAWAAQVKALGLPCAVGDVGAEQLKSADGSASGGPCAVAVRSGCECFHPPVRSPTGAHRWDINGVMAFAVRWRFLYAKQLLMRGHPVLMHDADVFFRPDGLAVLTRWIARANSSTAAVDFAVQNNGARTQTFDDLNWGFVWMSGSKASVHLLGCTLDAWMHKAFAPPSNNPHNAYHARSQPRINHVLESAISAARTPWEAPRVCTFRTNLVASTMRHLSGYTTAGQKMMCARALGILDDPPSDIRGQLAYAVPLNATVADQKRALAAALALGESIDYGVAIPAASFSGRRVPFCQLFDANTLPERRRMTRALGRIRLKHLCAPGGVQAHQLASSAAIVTGEMIGEARKLRQERHGHGLRKLKRRSSSLALPRCVDFGSLLRLNAFSSSTFEHHERLRTCDPLHESVIAIHACHPRAPAPLAGL